MQKKQSTITSSTNCPGACVGEKKCSLSQKNLNIIYKNIQKLFKNNPEVKIVQQHNGWISVSMSPQKDAEKVQLITMSVGSYYTLA